VSTSATANHAVRTCIPHLGIPRLMGWTWAWWCAGLGFEEDEDADQFHTTHYIEEQ